MLFPLNADTRWILGRGQMFCSRYANLLRKTGRDIPAKAEEEQAAVIYWFLELYEFHGDKWRAEAERQIRAMVERKDA